MMSALEESLRQLHASPLKSNQILYLSLSPSSPPRSFMFWAKSNVTAAKLRTVGASGLPFCTSLLSFLSPSLHLSLSVSPLSFLCSHPLIFSLFSSSLLPSSSPFFLSVCCSLPLLSPSSHGFRSAWLNGPKKRQRTARPHPGWGKLQNAKH